MASWHAVLPGDLTPIPVPRIPGNKLMVWGSGETGAGIGHADVIKQGNHLVVSMDDSTFTDRCRGGPKGDSYAKAHSHRGDISNGYCPYLRPILVKTPKGYNLIGVQLAGLDLEDGNTVDLKPGSRVVPSIPPRPKVTVLGE